MGYCAEVAERSKGEFIKCLGQNGVSIFGFDSDEEFMRSLRMRKVIVNSTPLIALCHVNQLNVLKQLYGEITIVTHFLV